MNRITSLKPQIFLLHYAGGDRNSFRPLIENLQPHFQVETPELPGRGNRMSELSFIPGPGYPVATKCTGASLSFSRAPQISNPNIAPIL